MRLKTRRRKRKNKTYNRFIKGVFKISGRADNKKQMFFRNGKAGLELIDQNAKIYQVLKRKNKCIREKILVIVEEVPKNKKKK